MKSGMVAALSFFVAMQATAALVDERTSEAGRLDSAAKNGAIVYADETQGSVSIRISLEGFGVAEAQLYVGDVGPVAVSDSTNVEVVCLFDGFRVIPLRLVAGDDEIRAGVAVYRSRGEAQLVHVLDSPKSRLDLRDRVKIAGTDPIRYSALWGGGDRARVVAYRASEYGTPGAQGIEIVNRLGDVEGAATLGGHGISLESGDYVLEHFDGVQTLTRTVKIGRSGFFMVIM